MSPPCEKEAIGYLQGESTCDGVEAPKPLLLEHIVRLYRNSECRTPLISLRSCGDPLPTLRWLAAAQGLSVWSIVLDSQKAEQNALDYLEVGFKNGDWVCLHVLEQVPCEATLRQIALLLMTLEPEPELYPKREMFRLWLTLDTMDFDINDHIRSPLPTLLRKNALYGTRRECDDENMSCPHRTTVKKLEAVEPTLYTQSLSHRQDRLRRTQRPPECEEDSGSDMEEPEAKLTGLWFHRHAELHDPSHTAVSSHHHSFVTFDGAGLTDQSLRYLELLFRAIQCGLYDDAVGVIESTLQQYESVVTSSELLNGIWRQGRTPLMWSVLYGRMRITTYLLEHGADPNVVAQSTACPLLFMGLETVEELELLLKFRLDTDVMFEGKTFAEHPNSSPILIKYLKQKEC